MFYEVRFTGYFDSLAIPDQIKQALLAVWSHTHVINPGQENQECSTVDVLKNFHDENPHQPCEPIFHKDNCPD